jgi:hypothetical protein
VVSSIRGGVASRGYCPMSEFIPNLCRVDPRPQSAGIGLDTRPKEAS